MILRQVLIGIQLISMREQLVKLRLLCLFFTYLEEIGVIEGAAILEGTLEHSPSLADVRHAGFEI